MKIPHKLGIERRKENKKSKIKLIDTLILSSSPSCVRSKIKSLPEEKPKSKTPADYYLSPLVIDDDFKMGDMSCGNFSMKKNTLSQQNCDSNNGDMSSWHGFKNSHTIYQCKDSSTFKDINGNVEKGDCDVSSGYGVLNSHNIPQCEY